MQNDPTPSNVTGERVRQLRRAFGWSVEDLAERCAQVGATTLTVPALYVIESGRREKSTGRRRRMITVDEWLALAKAFGVAPVVLLLPQYRDAEVQITGEVVADAEKVHRWVVGRWPDLLPAGQSTLSDDERHRYLTSQPTWMGESVELSGSEALAKSSHLFAAAHAVAREAKESDLTRGDGKPFLQALEPLVANILRAGDDYDPQVHEYEEGEDASGTAEDQADQGR